LHSAARAAPTFTVTRTDDAPGTGDLGDGVCAAQGGGCTLRAAVMEANHIAGGGATIVLPAGTLAIGNAPLGAGSESDGDLDVTAPTTLVGEGPSATMIDGGGISRVFHTDAPGVAMRNLGIQNGSDLTIGTNTGGGIDNDGELTLENVAVLSN